MQEVVAYNDPEILLGNYIQMHTINIVYAHEALLVLIVNVHITLCLVNACEHAYKINNVVAQQLP